MGKEINEETEGLIQTGKSETEWAVDEFRVLAPAVTHETCEN